MRKQDIIRTAIAIRQQSGGDYGDSRASAEEVLVPLLEAENDNERPELRFARVAVWSKRGRVRGELTAPQR